MYSKQIAQGVSLELSADQEKELSALYFQYFRQQREVKVAFEGVFKGENNSIFQVNSIIMPKVILDCSLLENSLVEKIDDYVYKAKYLQAAVNRMVDQNMESVLINMVREKKLEAVDYLMARGYLQANLKISEIEGVSHPEISSLYLEPGTKLMTEHLHLAQALNEYDLFLDKAGSSGFVAFFDKQGKLHHAYFAGAAAKYTPRSYWCNLAHIVFKNLNTLIPSIEEYRREQQEKYDRQINALKAVLRTFVQETLVKKIKEKLGPDADFFNLDDHDVSHAFEDLLEEIAQAGRNYSEITSMDLINNFAEKICVRIQDTKKELKHNIAEILQKGSLLADTVKILDQLKAEAEEYAGIRKSETKKNNLKPEIRREALKQNGAE